MSQKKHRVIGLGGTFDHFHAGHRFFLDFAASLSDNLGVGVATNTLTQNKMFADQIESYEVREQAVQKYFQHRKISGTTFALNDIFGPTLEGTQIEAIAVTETTKSGGQQINQERTKRGLKELPLYICQLLPDENGEGISSTRIRQGVINRDGKVFANIFAHDVILNAQQRLFFQHKQGDVIQVPNPQRSLRYVVGDIVLETFVKEHWPYNLGIYDYKNHRDVYSSTILQILQPMKVVQNPPGSISKNLVETMLSLMLTKDSPVIQIDGEEDLAAVALVLLAPLGSAIYYGQFGEGIIEMVVTEELKEKIWSVLHS